MNIDWEDLEEKVCIYCNGAAKNSLLLTEQANKDNNFVMRIIDLFESVSSTGKKSISINTVAKLIQEHYS
jgi:hypothetical protein